MGIMLNKDDIQTIRQVVKEEVSDLIKPIKKDIISLKTDMKSVKSDIHILKQDVSYISREFDSQIIDTIRRVDRIEDHLHLPPLQTN